jgi:hypothetical protein
MQDVESQDALVPVGGVLQIGDIDCVMIEAHQF